MERLGLAFNLLDASVGAELCDWLPRTALKSLDLWGNELGADGCYAVVDGLRYTHSLNSVGLFLFSLHICVGFCGSFVFQKFSLFFSLSVSVSLCLSLSRSTFTLTHSLTHSLTHTHKHTHFSRNYYHRDPRLNQTLGDLALGCNGLTSAEADTLIETFEQLRAGDESATLRL